MSARVIFVAPDTTVHDIATVLRKHSISAVPVLEPDGSLARILGKGAIWCGQSRAPSVGRRGGSP